MTEMQRQQAAGAHRIEPAPPQPTGWVGWILFAGIMLIIGGAFQAIAGFVAIFNDKYYVVPDRNLVLTVDYTAWGWVHLALGLLAVLAGFAVMRGRMWGRIFAVLVASVSAVVDLAFLNAAPFWNTIMIAVSVLVIWAVVVHGREVKSLD